MSSISSPSRFINNNQLNLIIELKYSQHFESFLEGEKLLKTQILNFLVKGQIFQFK